MRIVLTTDYYPPHFGGGVEAVVSQLASHLAAADHEVLVITIGERAAAGSEQIEGVTVRRFPGIRMSRVTGLELTISIAAQRSIKRTIAQFGPDVVNAHHLYFATTLPTLTAANDLGVPAVLTLHVAGMESFGGWRGAVARFYERRMGGRIVDQADALIAVSEAVAVTVHPHTRSSVSVIPNGVDLRRFKPPASRQRSNARIIYVGRLIANKGPDIALSAFREVHREMSDATLLMVGDGPMRKRLENYARSNHITHSVEFLGLREDVADLMRQSEVFVRPSFVEGMPLTVLEAMACGLPVVASNVGGVSEIVQNGETGLVVPPGSVASVASALLRLLGDETLSRKMGEAGRTRVMKRHSWEAATAATYEVFSTVVRGAA